MDPHHTRYVIDREAVEAEVANTRALHDAGVRRWFVRQALLNLTIFSAVAAAVSFREVTTTGMSPSKLAVTIAFAILGAIALAWLTGRQRFRNEALDVERRMQEIANDLHALGGPGWARRSLLVGLGLGAGVGIPIGVLMMALWRPEDLPGANRWLTIPAFVGMTMMWAIPMAFLLRWVTLLALKRLVKVAGE